MLRPPGPVDPRGRRRLAIDPRLLELMVCPACHAEIEVVADGHGLECRGCGRVYPVRDGFPVMLVDQASTPRRDSAENDPVS